MKGFLKVFAVAAAMALLGLLLMLAGFVTGGAAATRRAMDYTSLAQRHYRGPLPAWLERALGWADGAEAGLDGWTEGLEDDLDRWADEFENSMDAWADGVEDWAEDVESWADGLASRAGAAAGPAPDRHTGRGGALPGGRPLWPC